MKKTLFISDLHLEANRPDITDQFLGLLSQLDAHVEALYILGDLFEVWIGDDEHTPLHQQVIAGLKAVTQRGIPVYLMHGNRDFLIGRTFLKRTGCKLLTEPSKISLYQTPVLLMHGDTLCTRDIAYLKARKKARNVLLQRLFLWLPLNLRKKIANNMRKASQKHTHTTAPEIMDVTQQEVERVMNKYGVQTLIHGHTHRLNKHEFLLREAPATRFVLGAWHEKSSVLVWNETGTKTFL